MPSLGLFGSYTHRWEAEAVARSFRRDGHSVSVIRAHSTLYRVLVKA